MRRSLFAAAAWAAWDGCVSGYRVGVVRLMSHGRVVKLAVFLLSGVWLDWNPMNPGAYTTSPSTSADLPMPK